MQSKGAVQQVLDFWFGDPPGPYRQAWFTKDPAFDARIREQFLALLREGGVEFAEEAAYADPVGLSGSAREILARFKAAGVTTVLFSGDPLAPQALTQAATEQGYFPEWVITGSGLVDTTIFGRTYDQEQWRHAFGPSNLFARVSPTVAGSGYLYRWYFDGTSPPAQQSALILPNLQLLKVRGHAGDVGNETADYLATMAVRRESSLERARPRKGA